MSIDRESRQRRLHFPDAGDLENDFRLLHRQLIGTASPPVEISFYPYAGFKHTIRSRDGRILLRLSDLVKGAPSDVLQATLALLICRLYDTRPPEEFERIYAFYSMLPEVREASLEARAQRGHKQLTHTRGRIHDLRRLFGKLNREYFEGRLEVKHLSWSPGRSRRVLGHYDRAHDAIILNRILDQPLVPDFVVEYVLYHEMLHADLGEERQGTRRDIHHKRFRRAEQEFAHYSRARRFIREELS